MSEFTLAFAADIDVIVDGRKLVLMNTMEEDYLAEKEFGSVQEAVDAGQEIARYLALIEKILN